MNRLGPILLLLTGCAARTVQVEVPVAAAVQVETSRVAVISAEPACRTIADALTRQLSEQANLTVDPAASTRVAVVGCHESLLPTVSIDSDGRRSRGWEGRSSALIVVEQDQQVLGRLIGTGGDGADLMPTRRTPLKRALHDDLVADVVDQVSPTGLAERRVYPSAAPDSPKGLETRAIAAELAGNLDSALELAQAAHALSPSTRLAAYIGELERRILLSD